MITKMKDATLNVILSLVITSFATYTIISISNLKQTQRELEWLNDLLWDHVCEDHNNEFHRTNCKPGYNNY